jgi:hypothetical protein
MNIQNRRMALAVDIDRKPARTRCRRPLIAECAVTDIKRLSGVGVSPESGRLMDLPHERRVKSAAGATRIARIHIPAVLQPDNSASLRTFIDLNIIRTVDSVKNISLDTIAGRDDDGIGYRKRCRHQYNCR